MSVAQTSMRTQEYTLYKARRVGFKVAHIGEL
jgi:hypothetical protein